jgi:bacterioferritin
MKGSEKVIALLNEVLKAELTAINQYFVHAEMCENWGYKRLSTLIKQEAISEMKHAEMLIERILYLEGTPNMSDYFKINIGNDVKKQFDNDLALEKDAYFRLNEGIELCHQEKDSGSRKLLEAILKDEEEHIDWIESQLHVIEEIGLDNYLTEQIYIDEPSQQ